MARPEELFKQKLKVVNIGIESFYETMKAQDVPVVHVDWKPAAGGNEELMGLLEKLKQKPAGGKSRIDAANEEALSRINRGEPILVDIKYAWEVLPGMAKNVISHAGPPLAWKDMSGPVRGAVIGAIKYEGLAETDAEAEQVVLDGKVVFKHNHSLGAVGPMTGMITYSMPLYEVRNEAFGNLAYCTFNEGLGKVMRFGANDENVIRRLKWLETTLAPVLKETLARFGPLNLKVMIARALAMGDEMHQRNIAASSLFLRDMAPKLAQVVADQAQLAEILAFISGNEQFFLNLAMAAGKAIMDPVKNIPDSTIVTAMSRNGTNFGVKVSGLGEQWFEAPVEMPVGLYFPGYSEKDANPDVGDSTIVETFGIGGFAMASAPAVVRFVGAENVEAAYSYTREMREITVGTSPHYVIPTLDFIGTPTGIDIRKVVETNIQPVINTGMAGKVAGVGQVGAGIVKAPMDCFVKAVKAFAEQYDPDRSNESR